MLVGTTLRSACPRCRARLLRSPTSRYFDILQTFAPFTTAPTPRVAACQARQHQAKRHFTSSPQARESALQSVAPTSAELEAVVRQAKRTFGNTLPKDYLSEKEYRLYERLYGAPLRPTEPQDVGITKSMSDGDDELPVKNALLREHEDGGLQEVEYVIEEAETTKSMQAQEIDAQHDVQEATEALSGEVETLASSDDFIRAQSVSQREYDALKQLQQDFEISNAKAAARAATQQAAEEEEDDVDEDEENDVDEEDVEEEDPEADAVFRDWPSHEGPRIHPHTSEGRFGTTPSTIQLPRQQLIEPITELLGRTDSKAIKKAAERAFGGPGLPYGPATPLIEKRKLQKPVMMQATQRHYSEMEADTYLAAVMPGVYASTTSVLTEVRKRLGPEWIRGLIKRKDDAGEGPRVLDFGAGGAGLAAWENILNAEWQVMREKGEVAYRAPPPGRKTVIVGSDHLRNRLSTFLENTTFLPRVPDYIHSAVHTEGTLDFGGAPPPKKTFDIIIATHLLMPLEQKWQRRELIDNLWQMLSADGGVLIVLEKGHPRGFEMVADVRQRMLDEFIIPSGAASSSSSPSDASEDSTAAEASDSKTKPDRDPGMIIAPCTNHTKCPMYLTPGQSAGRKDFCRFRQRFSRPLFLQKIHGVTHKSHEDINFSYLAIRRGTPPPTSSDPSPSESASLSPTLNGESATSQAFKGYLDASSPDYHPLSLPRITLPPLKSKGHVTLDLCTPSGSIERWTVPRSFGKQAYHDARKSKWGDLWALGAKTRTARTIRMGKSFQVADGVVREDESAGSDAVSEDHFDAESSVESAAKAVNHTKKGGDAAKKVLKARIVAGGGNGEDQAGEKGPAKGPRGRRKGVIAEMVMAQGRANGQPERRTKRGRIPTREMRKIVEEAQI